MLFFDLYVFFSIKNISVCMIWNFHWYSFYFVFQDSGSAEFSKYTLESLNHFCLDQIKKYEKYHTRNGFKRASVVDTIGKLVCPNDCSSHGVCNEGICLSFKILCKVRKRNEYLDSYNDFFRMRNKLYVGNLLNMKCFKIIMKAMHMSNWKISIFYSKCFNNSS